MDQDSRFFNKDKKLIKKMKFPPNISTKASDRGRCTLCSSLVGHENGESEFMQIHINGNVCTLYPGLTPQSGN